MRTPTSASATCAPCCTTWVSPSVSAAITTSSLVMAWPKSLISSPVAARRRRIRSSRSGVCLRRTGSRGHPRRRNLQRERIRARGRIRPKRRRAMVGNIRYEIILYWSQEDQVFIAEVPELPGCAADGATYQEAVNNVEVVIREWIETAQELG